MSLGIPFKTFGMPFISFGMPHKTLGKSLISLGMPFQTLGMLFSALGMSLQSSGMLHAPAGHAAHNGWQAVRSCRSIIEKHRSVIKFFRHVVHHRRSLAQKFRHIEKTALAFISIRPAMRDYSMNGHQSKRLSSNRRRQCIETITLLPRCYRDINVSSKSILHPCHILCYLFTSKKIMN